MSATHHAILGNLAAPLGAAAADDLASEAMPLPEKAAKAEFPLPPAELVDELDNQAPSKSDAEAAAPEDLVTLDFVGDELPFRDFTLRYPFRWDGRVVDRLRVRQLTTAEVGQISGEWTRTQRAPDYFDLYAVMTGVPAKVLRAMPSTDSEPVIAAAFDFLPPLFRPADG